MTFLTDTSDLYDTTVNYRGRDTVRGTVTRICTNVKSVFVPGTEGLLQ